jgi:hypothetical protein
MTDILRVLSFPYKVFERTAGAVGKPVGAAPGPHSSKSEKYYVNVWAAPSALGEAASGIRNGGAVASSQGQGPRSPWLPTNIKIVPEGRRQVTQLKFCLCPAGAQINCGI